MDSYQEIKGCFSNSFTQCYKTKNLLEKNFFLNSRPVPNSCGPVQEYDWTHDICLNS